MKKKSDKVIILLIAILIFMVMSWIVEGGAYSSGQFASTGVSQIGLFDVFLAIYSAFFRMLPDILYILVVGGCYEVLSQTKGYQKMVDKVSNFIKGKESIALAVITLLMGLYTSITSHILVLICVAPFIVSVFLRNGKDRLTALSAGFGGIFLGYLGLTFGTYGIAYINSAMGLNTSNWIVQKFVIFIVAYILYVLFAILHMRKCKKVNEVKYDHFYTEELDETKVKRKNKTKVWPTALICIIGVLVLALGYIDWTTSFNIKTFAEFHTSFTGGFKVADVPVFGTIIGSYMNAFGEWTDLLYGSFIIVLLTAIVALVNKIKIDTLFQSFGKGMRKNSRMAFVYGLALSMAFLSLISTWPTTIINTLFGSGSFNIFIIVILAVIAQILLVDPDCFAQTFGAFLAVTFTDNIVAAGILWRLGSAIAFIIGPTSFLLLSVLTYLDIPYKDWLKYIWKFVLLFLIVVMLVLAIIIYV